MGVFMLFSPMSCWTMCFTFKQPVYRNHVWFDWQERENCKRIHSSLGTGVFGGHLSTTLLWRSCTEIALATQTTVECHLSLAPVPTSSSICIYSLAQDQNWSNLVFLHNTSWGHIRMLHPPSQQCLNMTINFSWDKFIAAEESHTSSLYRCLTVDFLVFGDTKPKSSNASLLMALVWYCGISFFRFSIMGWQIFNALSIFEAVHCQIQCKLPLLLPGEYCTCIMGTLRPCWSIWVQS